MLHETSFLRSRSSRLNLALVLFALLIPGGAKGELYPSSHVLIPYFEVDLTDPGFGPTTLFSVSNSSHRATDVRFTVHTNWGIPVLELTRRLAGGEVATFNLRDWLADGNLPGGQLSEIELAHLRTALSGKPSPKDALYYSTSAGPDLAVGYITIRTLGTDRPDVLWGDFFVVDPGRNSFQAETLVDLDSSEAWAGCKRHVLRFVNAGPLERGTQVILWTGRRLAPSPSPEPAGDLASASVRAFDEAGRQTEHRSLDALAVQVLEVGDLGLTPPYGWLDIRTKVPAHIAQHLHTTTGASAELHSYCLPEETLSEDPAILIRPFVNGTAADDSPILPMGSTLDWEYVVGNNGILPLSGIVVSDDSGLEVICPKDALDPGESMSCTAQSTASVCQNIHTIQVTARTPDGLEVSGYRTVQYYGQHHASIDIVVSFGDDDANEPPGPAIPGYGTFWVNVAVTNPGDVALTDVVVEGKPEWYGMSHCPTNAALQPGERLECFFRLSGMWGGRFEGSVSGRPPCGPEVTASDPVYYHPFNPVPFARMEKWLDGQQVNNPPGPTIEVGSPIPWEYHITNLGDIPLSPIQISDEGGVVVTCPTSSLAPGKSMACSGTGVAEACVHGSIATLYIYPPGVTYYAGGYYFGSPHPAVEIEVRTNGEDADEPPGPIIPVGETVEWTYLVTNIGDVALKQVQVSDQHLVACPQNTLAIGEAMTCNATGTAASGQHSNVGHVWATPLCGHEPSVSDLDPSHYFGQ